MARARPSRMLPPSQTAKPTGAGDPAYDANAAIVGGLLENHGEVIHWWGNDEGHACSHADDFRDGPPLSIVLPPGERVGSTGKLATSFMPWAGSRDGNCLCVFRLEFEREVAAHRPDLLEATRTQLDAAYARQDGPVVVVILPEHLIVTTCIDRTQAN